VAGKLARQARRPGQHFLRSLRVVRSLVDAAGIEPGDLVVDVGAGRGAITAELIRRGAQVWAVEADPALATSLRERFAPRASVIEADARRLSWPRRPFTVVANLPFSGANEILGPLLGNPAVPLRRAELVVQWEAATKRTAVWPSTLLGVLWGALYELRLVGRLDPTAFAPPPSVDAGVMRAVRRPEPLVPAERFDAYRLLVRRAFDAKAPVRRVLPARVVKRLGDELGFSPSSFPRDLDARQWAELFARAR
jgi:23S rRNA (adenine-N6)-dimethyltransferase